MSALAQMEKDTLVSAESLAAAATKRGLFVVLEGIDGSGKSSAAMSLFEILSKEMPGGVILTAEPTETWLGDCVRRANQENAGAMTEALLFVADRAEHGQRIEQWLREGKIVLCDRYFASTIAYQGAALKQSMGVKNAIEWLKAVNEPIIVPPDITLLFTIRVEMALERLKQRSGISKFENLEYLREVDLVYRFLCMEDPTYFTIDASRPLEQVIQMALAAIRAKL
ncbi:MAG: dTMP kinase [Methanomassiliicoccales archaeon]|nr:dTMP kinase [Methanomassiliicoccales archaeon]